MILLYNSYSRFCWRNIPIQYQLCSKSAPRNITLVVDDNILGKDWKNSHYYIYCPHLLKTYQRDNKLFEFSRDTNREELNKTRKKDVNSKWFCSSCLVAMVIASRVHTHSYVYKVTIFLDNGLHRKISAYSHELLSQ